MKKRVLSMFMALALCLTLLPAPVRAAEDTPESGAIVQEEQEEATPAISEQAAENGIAVQDGRDSTVSEQAGTNEDENGAEGGRQNTDTPDAGGAEDSKADAPESGEDENAGNNADAAAEYRFIRTISVYGTAVLPLLEALDLDGDKAWRKWLMAAVRTQAAFYPHFLEPRLAPGEELTPTELQILHLLCTDKSNAEIAQIMDVKLPTVKTHVSHILEKLDVKRRTEAKTAAKKLHLVQDDL